MEGYLNIMLFLALILLAGSRLGHTACNKIDECSCRDDESGKVVSLHPLASTNPDVPAFNVTGIDPYYYSYNPCLNYSVRGFGSCIDVALCQQRRESPLQNYAIGLQPLTTFISSNSSSLSIVYKTASQFQQRESRIELVCDEGEAGKLEFLKEDPVLAYNFRLTSKCACPGGCSGEERPTCTPEGPKNCGCRLSTNNELINLLSLDNPSAPLTVSTASSTIYLNLCSGMSLGSGCEDAVACVHEASEYKEYGHPSTGNYSVDASGHVVLRYTSLDGARTTSVRLVCDQAQRHYPRLVNVGEPTSTLLEVELHSVCACPGECFSPALTCTRVDDCTCSLNEQLGTLDLHNLDNPAAPLRFFRADESNPGAGQWYYYNPCTGFSISGNQDSCIDVAACQLGEPVPIDFSLGFQNTVTYRVSNTDSSAVTLLYTGGLHDRQVAVTVHCNESISVPRLEYDKEDPAKHYYVSLYSRDACPKSVPLQEDTKLNRRKIRPSRPITRT